jgi:hypothetical protein
MIFKLQEIILLRFVLKPYFDMKEKESKIKEPEIETEGQEIIVEDLE